MVMPQLPVGNPSVIRLQLRFWILDFRFWIKDIKIPQSKIENLKSKISFGIN